MRRINCEQAYATLVVALRSIFKADGNEVFYVFAVKTLNRSTTTNRCIVVACEMHRLRRGECAINLRTVRWSR